MHTYVKCGALLLIAGLLAASCKKEPQTDSSAQTSQTTPPATITEPEIITPETPPADAVQVAAIGQPAPDFTLSDTGGASHSLSEHLAAGNTVVLEWFNPGCSVVHHYYQESTAMADSYKAAQTAAGGKLVWLAINSQDPAKGGGALADNEKAITDWGIPYPVLLDPSGSTGKAYGMSATPCIAVISPDGVLQYRGSLDEYAKGGAEPPVGTNYVVQAVTELAAGQPVSNSETQALG